MKGISAFWARFGGKPAATGTDVAPAPSRRLRPRSAATVGVAASGSRSPLRIAGLTLADPETSFTQDEVLSLLDLRDDEFARRIFSRSGVKRRHLNLTAEFLDTTLQGRTEKVEQQLTGYAVEAVERLGVDVNEIGTVITSTLYSLGCPTLAHRLVEHLEMDPTTDKYHVVGVGCASAIPLIRLVANTLPDHPGKKGLVVAADSMTGILMGAREDDARSKTVGSSIFGDGCAAMLIDDDPEATGPAILASEVRQVGGTLGAVKLELAPDDSYLHIAKELPDVAGANLRGPVDEFLRKNGMTGHMIDHWLIHPGGRRIIESAQEALSLSDEHVAISFDVLANHGNTGTPSIFYVMDKTFEQRAPCPGEHGLVVTIGPGVTIGLMLLRW